MAPRRSSRARSGFATRAKPATAPFFVTGTATYIAVPPTELL
jgi:hypothetical protein